MTVGIATHSRRAGKSGAERPHSKTSRKFGRVQKSRERLGVRALWAAFAVTNEW
jgi:hypothetical protein